MQTCLAVAQKPILLEYLPRRSVHFTHENTTISNTTRIDALKELECRVEGASLVTSTRRCILGRAGRHAVAIEGQDAVLASSIASRRDWHEF